ncbi:hypothetical protein Lal_00020527 [Lupinus albus]|uniref:Uncharacterized protein n=1 Tax=Lupinus albus TaxID=3870 RepID=A0A6A5MIG5_LUPAL|nr:hypothetical protein Lalb_Chr08g0238901 [Lupinus albus]KAF1871733.1 hypothetical protein Lal_00020527 [Lupinus albus]
MQLSFLRLQPSNPGVVVYSNPNNFTVQRNFLSTKRRTVKPFCSLTLQSPSDDASSQQSHYTSTVGSSSLNLSHWNLTQRHLTLLNLLACVTAICTTWLFCSAIPTILAFKRAAESLEKLMDTTREELPDTMAAIRLSGMEISDLTTELSDIGQEIAQGVKSSTRAVRVAEERLRHFTTMPPSSPASLQQITSPRADEVDRGGGPVVATTARGIREGIVKGRSMLQMFFTLIQFSKFALNYITGRR